MKQTVLTNTSVLYLAACVAHEIKELKLACEVKLYGVPRGGVPALFAVLGCLNGLGVPAVIVNKAEEADVFIDDIIDSGATRLRYEKNYVKPFFALVDKTIESDFKHAGWIVFPWEGTAANGIEDNIVRLLQYVGEDPSRGGLLETPTRVAKAWAEWCSGYGKDPKDVLKTFEDGAEKSDEMVVVKDIPFYSHCEHHMAPFFGKVTIAYIPNGKIVGLSKLSRVVDIFAKRLQVQERLTTDIALAIQSCLAPKGVGVVIKARHMCMESRGIAKQGHETITSSMTGVFRADQSTRAEFLGLAG